MTEGIGARVLRKEDKRFLMGKGRYTDDIVEPNQAYAAFVRSPHAHAEVKGIDASAAKAMDGVVDVLNGEQLTGDGIGNIICGWAVTQKDGSGMNMGAWSALATNKVRYVGDAVAVVIADSIEQARNAAEAVEVDCKILPAVAQSMNAIADGAPEIHENAPGNLVFDWEIGDLAPTEAALAGAAHITELNNYRLSSVVVQCDVQAVYTNTVPVDAYRGAGRPEACYLVERIMETAAREMGVSPVELRCKNFVTSFPHETPVIMTYDSGDFATNQDQAMKAADYDGFEVRRTEAASRGKLRGIGFSNYIEACGIAPSAAVGSLGAGVGLWESAEVRVNPVGTIEVLTGSHSHGQGHETTFTQIVAERFGLPTENIQIVHGDTDKVQFGMGTYGSRSGAVGMSAIFKALDKVEAKAKKIAAHVLEASEDDIVIEGGEVKVAGTDKTMGWHEVGLAAYTGHNLPEGMEPGLKETSFYDPSNFTFPAGCYICEVEVDPETGVTDIIQFVASDDFGTIINPMIVEGQVHGGLAQGIGQALLEGVVYDDDAQQLSASYMDYAMPRADDLPNYSVHHASTECPGNPLGMKGCGEAGAIGSPPAVINAITDAIGNNDLSMPATPSKVWAALQAVSAKQAAE